MALPVDTELSIEDVVAVAREHQPVTLSDDARERMQASWQIVDDIVKQAAQPAVYGVNTGFGALADVKIPRDQLTQLQRNLIRSHAAGVGEPLAKEHVRALMLLRAAVLSRAQSGVRPLVAESICTFLNQGVHPRIPSRGSVGASGDLAPLAHLALGLIGEGAVEHEGQVKETQQLLAQLGISALTLAPKEGIALINGTQLMTGIGCLAIYDANVLCDAADIIGAMSLDALLGTTAAFDARVMGARGHAGQMISGARIRALLRDSAINASHEDCGKVQDPYSLRCMPQVHGATLDALEHCQRILETEVNACTDNPLVFADGDIVSGGNFHGQPIALPLDYAAIAIAEIANISERRVEQLVNPHLSSGLPPFLTQSSGIDSGFMMAQVSAAALVSENKVLAHPASVDSIPSSASREDHVSMGATAAHKLATIVDNVANVLAVELMCAAQALDLRAPLKTSRKLEAAKACVREAVPHLDSDRVLAPDIAACKAIIQSGALRDATSSV